MRAEGTKINIKLDKDNTHHKSYVLHPPFKQQNNLQNMQDQRQTQTITYICDIRDQPKTCMCWCQNGNVWNVEILTLLSQHPRPWVVFCNKIAPPSPSSDRYQGSQSLEEPPNRRHRIIFTSYILIVISPQGRWKVWVSGLHLWVFNSIQEVF